MNIAMFFIFLVCDLIIVPICWFSYGKRGEYKEGMILGVHIPQIYVNDPEVSAITDKSEKQWKKFHWLNLMASIAVCFLCFYDFILFLILWSVWLVEYVAGLYYLVIVPHRRMYRLKMKRGWIDGSSCRVVRIDTAVTSASEKMAVTWKWQLPILAAVSASGFFIWKMKEIHEAGSSETYAVWVLYGVSLMMCLVLMGVHMAVIHQSNKVYSENTEINLAVNRLSKRGWSQGLLLCSAVSGAAWIYLCVSYFRFGPGIPAGDYIIYILLAMLAAGCLLLPVAFASGRKKEFLASDQEPYYADDDEYWKKGWYNNPGDKHLLVQDRLNSLNYSFNYGRPAAKVLTAVSAGVIVLTVVWAVSLINSFNNAEVTFSADNGYYLFEGAGYECGFEKDEIRSIQLLDDMPDDSFSRTNGGSTEKVNIGYFRGKKTGKCMMFIYNDHTPVLEIQMDDITVFANSLDPEETEKWFHDLAGQ